MACIDQTTKNLPVAVEYHYIEGPVLMRVAKGLSLDAGGTVSGRGGRGTTA